MPPTRKTSGQSRLASGGRQATLSFNHRVTKASVPRHSAKESALAVTKRVDKATEPTETRRNKAELEEAEKAAKDDVEEAEESGEEEAVAEQTSRPSRLAVEVEAEAVSGAQIARYWRGIESQRLTKPVHQEALGMGEKVLRYFDVSSQFGPCVGITRKMRWLRAQRLGLSPPIEVLAVLLKEEEREGESVEQASIDGIMNPVVAA